MKVSDNTIFWGCLLTGLYLTFGQRVCGIGFLTAATIMIIFIFIDKFN